MTSIKRVLGGVMAVGMFSSVAWAQVAQDPEPVVQDTEPVAQDPEVAQDREVIAQDPDPVVPDPDPNERMKMGQGTPSQDLPRPQSDSDPLPPVPSRTAPGMGVTKQAGVGGTQAYARAGVLELGGSAGFAAASDYMRFELSPSIGLFLVDNLELSLLTSLIHFNLDGDTPGGDVSATEFRALIEPSFHLPFSRSLFGFLGVGAGVNYITGHDAGFVLQPRLGVKFLVGRSGLLSPSFNVAYSTVDAIRTEAGTVLAVQTSYGMNIGYTVMW